MEVITEDLQVLISELASQNIDLKIENIVLKRAIHNKELEDSKPDKEK